MHLRRRPLHKSSIVHTWLLSIFSIRTNYSTSRRRTCNALRTWSSRMQRRRRRYTKGKLRLSLTSSRQRMQPISRQRKSTMSLWIRYDSQHQLNRRPFSKNVMLSYSSWMDIIKQPYSELRIMENVRKRLLMRMKLLKLQSSLIMQRKLKSRRHRLDRNTDLTLSRTSMPHVVKRLRMTLCLMSRSVNRLLRFLTSRQKSTAFRYVSSMDSSPSRSCTTLKWNS